jgi:hypothetical protein
MSAMVRETPAVLSVCLGSSASRGMLPLPRQTKAALARMDSVSLHLHLPVGQVEGLLNAIAVVDVDVDVQHTRVVLEELQDGQDEIVHVAEAGRLQRQSRGQGRVCVPACVCPSVRPPAHLPVYMCLHTSSQRLSPALSLEESQLQ